MKESRIIAAIVERPIIEHELYDQVGDATAGAVVTFAGVVRNHDHGRQVQGIEYSSHPLSTKILAQIASGIADNPNVTAVGVYHRIGWLEVGDIALLVAISAPHRQPAFEAAMSLIDQVKAELPIWKKQVFTDGSHEWTACS